MTTDLSEHHGPISDLFDDQAGSQDRQGFRLADDQYRAFHRDGFVSGIRILNDQQVDELCRQLDGIRDPDHPGNGLYYEFHTNESTDPDRVLFHALGAWRIASGFHDILWNPAFTVPAGQLLNGPVRFWHDQLFCKPARHGGVVAWHQDYSYWTRTSPMAHLTCWIGLDDSDESNGCLQYIPGSHQWDLLPITGLAGDMDSIRAVLTDEQWECFRPTPVVLKRGEAAFHHPLLIHGSRENSTDRPRRATVINVCRDGVRSESDDPLLAGVPVVPPGEPLGGQFFPLLSDPESTT